MKKIDPNKWYWLHEVHSSGFIPFVKTYSSLRRMVDRGMLKANVYTAVKNKKFSVKGKSIIEFLAKWESGDFN